MILENLQPAAQHRYYLQYNGKTSTVDVFTHIVNDRCCGELVRFKDIQVDGTSVSRIELLFD